MGVYKDMGLVGVHFLNLVLKDNISLSIDSNMEFNGNIY